MSTEIREHLSLWGFLEGIENIQVQLGLRKNLVDANITLDKALEIGLHIEAVTKIEEENSDPRVSAIQWNENFQLFSLINDLVRTLQINQSKSQDNQRL